MSESPSTTGTVFSYDIPHSNGDQPTSLLSSLNPAHPETNQRTNDNHTQNSSQHLIQEGHMLRPTCVRNRALTVLVAA